MKTSVPLSTEADRRSPAAVVQATRRFAGGAVSQHIALHTGAYRLQDSPRRVAQRVQPAAAFDPAARREAVPQEEELQVAYRNAQVKNNGLRPADVLALQRTVGNRGVQRMLAKHAGNENDEQQGETAEKNAESKRNIKIEKR